uniref:hypothetical protein n=1 Tax=Thauera sp. SDU_THAU2 TaxID=3136633 RepID=UPI00311E444F
MSSMTSGKRSLSAASPWREDERDVAYMLEKVVGEHHVEHRVADGHGQRIAAIGRAVRAGRHAGSGLGRRQTGAEREATADALGHRHDVGRDARPFVGEEPARAADAGLDLVEDQQQAVFVAEPAQFLEGIPSARGRMPPSPWTGSMRMAAVSSVMASLTAVMSPKGT